MADTQAFHYACGNDFVKRLLMERIGAALYKAPCAIDDLPPFLRVPSDVLSGELKSMTFRFLQVPNKMSPISSEKSF